MEGAAEDGDRCPFDEEGAEEAGFWGSGGADDWIELRACLAAVFGLRLRVLARFSTLESEYSVSSVMGS